jgi:putative ABC transport system permease protein
MRSFRALLHLYPSSFRREYGGEMEAVFARERRGASGAAVPALWLRTLADTLWNAGAVHADLLRQDLRYAARALARSPGFAFTAIAVTALGIGANTAAFSVADFVLVRPLPYAEPSRLAKLWQKDPHGRNEVSPANFRDWKAMSSSWEAMGASTRRAVNLVGRGEPQRLEGSAVTAGVLPLLGVEPAVGRVFTEADDAPGAPGTIVLSHGLWQSEFGGGLDVVGKKVTLDGEPCTVVGVMPREFRFPSRSVRFWTPLRLAAGNFDDRDDTFLEVIARRKRGVTLAAARAEMDLVASRLERQYPKENEAIGIYTFDLRDELSAQSKALLFALSAAAFCVLLIACANLGNLLLARALRRRRELAVRAALGAGRERLVRQLVTESLLLAACGGALGIAVAHAGVPLLTRLVPDALPIGQAPAVDVRALAFAAVLAAVTGIGFGVLPALRASAKVDSDALRSGAREAGGRRQRMRSALVVVEVAASVVLLVSAGLLLRALWRLRATDPGFRAEGVLTVRTALPWNRYQETAKRERFYASVLENVRRLPGVSSAAYATGLPMSMTGGIWPVQVEGVTVSNARADDASVRFATPGLFAALGIPFVAGRDFAETDRLDHPPVAIVSAAFARRHFPGADPIGRRFKVGGDVVREICGVVGDVRVRGPERKSEPQVYVSSAQVKDGNFVTFAPKDLAVRASGDLLALVPAIRRIVTEADPEQPVSDVKTMDQIVGDQTAPRAAHARILLAFAALAFVLAGVGIHGVLSYAVASRGQELAVRMALGAEAKDVVRMVLRQSARLAAAGVLPGLVLSYATAHAMRTLLAGVGPRDAPTFGAVAVLCFAMTLLGSLAPALRAVRISPLEAMRAE